MNAYEELLSIMRGEGRKDNTAPIQLGTMESETTCKVGNVLLYEDDFLVAEHLKTGYHQAVDNEIPERKNEKTFVGKLQKGDTVAVYKISDELYVILERLVTI